MVFSSVLSRWVTRRKGMSYSHRPLWKQRLSPLVKMDNGDLIIEEMQQVNACKIEGFNGYGVGRHFTCLNELFGFVVIDV